MDTFAKRLRWLTTLSLAALMIAALLAASASAAAVSWTGAAAPDVSWSSASIPNNWSSTPGLPASTDDITFTNTGAATAPAVTNEVTASTAVSTIWYSQQSDTPFAAQRTLIDSGQTLTISGSTTSSTYLGLNGPYALLAGNAGTSNTMNSQTVITGADNTSAMNISSWTGSSTTSGDIVVSETTPTSLSAASANAVLDMSGLTTFTASVDQLLVGYNTNNTSGIAYERANGTLFLAKNNTITMNNPGSLTSATNGGLVIGYEQRSANKTSTVYLGQTNTLYLTTAEIGARRETGKLTFNPAVIASNPSVKMRGLGSTDLAPVRVSQIVIGDNVDVNTGNQSDAIGTMDLTGGSADILATSIILARTPSIVGNNSRGAQGTLTFSAGTIDTTGMTVGLENGNWWPISTNVTGVVNVSGTGHLIVGSSGLTLAKNLGALGLSAVPSGTLNISGGTVSLSTDLTDGGGLGGGNSTLTLTGGTLDLSGHLIGGIGASIDTVSLANGTVNNIAQINAGTLTINPGVTLGVLLSGPLDLGSTYDILNWSSKSGTFATVNLPGLAPGLSWDSSNLYVDGTIQVVPEPATSLLLIIAAGLGLMFRRTRVK